MSLIADQACREVGDDLVAVGRQTLRQPDRRLDAAARRGGDGDGDLTRNVGGDEVLDLFRWQYLVSGRLQEADQSLAGGFVGETDAT